MAGRGKRVCVVALAGAMLMTGLAGTPAFAAAGRTASPSATTADVPVPVSTAADKVAAARAIGVPADQTLLNTSDQQFVLAIWRLAADDTSVKTNALQAYLSSDPAAAYQFIKTGIFDAAASDAQVEIAAAEARSRRRSAAVVAGLDPSDTALIELDDRNFIIVLWQRVDADTQAHVKAAALDAFREGSTEDDWLAFLTTGVQAAAAADLADAIAKADADQAAQLLAQQNVTAKKSLLQLLQLPVTDERVNTPDREFVLTVHSEAKGVEVQLAAQAALDAPDDQLAQALHDFIFTGGSAANTRDEQAAAAKELADYQAKAQQVLDGALQDGFEPNLVAAARAALASPTILGLQTFLLKGADAALHSDFLAPYEGMTVELKGAQSGRCAGIAGAVGADAETVGAKAVLQDCAGQTVVQRWQMHKVADGTWALININSRQCLAATNPVNNSAVTQATCAYTDAAQQWHFEVLPSGLYQIRNVKSSLLITHSASTNAAGTTVMQSVLGSGDALYQQWRLLDIQHNMVNLAEPAKIQIQGVGSQRCIEVVDKVPADLTKIKTRTEIKDCKGQALSLWTLTDKGDHRYVLNNVQTGFCLDVMGAVSKNSAVLEQYNCIANAPNQQFVFRAAANGAVEMVSALTGAVVNVGGGATVNGSLLIMYQHHGASNELWKITAK
jgi:hypothetical protein